MADAVRIVVVDDHDLFRAGVIELLDGYPDLTVVGQGRNGADAIAVARDQRPDILLIDVEMPGPGIHSVVRQVCAQNPRTGIVVLTMHDDPKLIIDLIEAGVTAFLHKSADRVELAAAIGRAARRDDNVLLSVSRRTLSRMGHASVNRPLLSAREVEVLTLLSDAKSNHAIARELRISDGTVKRHLTNLYGKLGATSRLDAVRRGRAIGVIPAENVRIDYDSGGHS